MPIPKSFVELPPKQMYIVFAPFLIASLIKIPKPFVVLFVFSILFLIKGKPITLLTSIIALSLSNSKYGAIILLFSASRVSINSYFPLTIDLNASKLPSPPSAIKRDDKSICFLYLSLTSELAIDEISLLDSVPLKESEQINIFFML